ncbi:hypothetical protein TL16_g10569 [Triparma laevis f. inornata]|uniref:Uncharacterized protein n=1 Tax=Triparma laevis f. inornata TaxID=1714386 RepID=A0A9W7BEK7_9STRA|nr:hypothetical protein TL16_g10569 [Triparma laevis f. inornata]
MWIKPFDASTGAVEELFTIAKEEYADSWVADECSTGSDGWYDLQVLQNDDKIEVLWAGQSVTRTENIQPGPCKFFVPVITVVKNEADELQPFHLVITFAEGSQKVYINGADVALGAWDVSSQNFSPTDSFHADCHLDFFSSEYLHHTASSDSIKPWPGNLYLFAIYDKVLTQPEAATNYAAKLGNSLPTVVDSTITINEDAEITATSHYSTPEWYGSATPIDELKSFDLTSLVSDADVDTVGYPNYNADGAPPTLWVGALPGFGTLYQNDGTEITTTDVEIASNTLKFRPVKDQNGASHDSFNIFAKDGTTELQSVGTTTITMDVTAVNDPPIPTDEVRENAVLVGVLTTSIFDLSGTDVDDAIASGYISTFPAHGELYPIEGDGVTFAATPYSASDADSDGDVAVGLKVGYKFTGDESTPSATGFLTNDQFVFRLKDASNAKSKTGTTSFEVFTSLEATPVSSDSFSCTEEEFSDVVLKGNDQGAGKRDLKYRIDSLPSHGELFDPIDTTTPLVVGDIVTATDVHDGSAYPGVAIKYKGNTDYFNYPTVMYNSSDVAGGSELESFTYNAVVASVTSAKSLPATQQIKVVNVNDPTGFTGPSGYTRIYALNGAQRVSREEFCEDEANAETLTCTTNEVAKITSVLVDEVDKNTDRVVVHMSTDKQNGRMSLNTEVLGLADFVSCNAPKPSTGRTWRCKGDGTTDEELIFLAQPTDLGKLLSGFESGCFHTNVTVAMMITDYDPDSVYDPSATCGWLPNCMKLPYQAMLGLFGFALICACCVCSCFKRWCRRRSARRKEAREAKKKAKFEMPEIAGEDLEEGIRDNRGGGATHGHGFKDIASKGLSMADGGLSKVKKTGLGGPAVGIALKGVKMAEKKLNNNSGGGDSGSKDALIPPNNSPSKKNPIRMQSGMAEKDEEAANLTNNPDPDALPPPPTAGQLKVDGDEEPIQRVKPKPPPIKKKASSKILEWLGYRDSGTGEMYFENTEDGRVTWTEPQEGFKNADA